MALSRRTVSTHPRSSCPSGRHRRTTAALADCCCIVRRYADRPRRMRVRDAPQMAQPRPRALRLFVARGSQPGSPPFSASKFDRKPTIITSLQIEPSELVPEKLPRVVTAVCTVGIKRALRSTSRYLGLGCLHGRNLEVFSFAALPRKPPHQVHLSTFLLSEQAGAPASPPWMDFHAFVVL